MTTLRHKDFQGSVDFVDGFLLIQILHIDDVITTQVDSASEAQAAFEQLVEDYLAACLEDGTEPCKPFKGSFNVRIAPDLHRKAAMAAAEERVSLNSWVQSAIETNLERDGLQEHFALLGRYARSIAHERVSAQYSAAIRSVRAPLQRRYASVLPAAVWSAPVRQVN